MTFKRSILCLAIYGILPTATSAIAQTEPSNSEENVIEKISVTGFRESLSSARQLKREATIIRDSIVAEDIADFPDLNLAEAIQRVPGVAINREAGEGRRVSLRGLGPDFTRVQLNGMEVLGNVDSPQDSRGQRSRDRAFDFNIFAAELFNRIDIEKTYAAEQDEGGMAGTIGLFTARPFDYDGFNLATRFQPGTNTATEDAQYRVAGLISNTWGSEDNGEFGALISVAVSSRETQEQGFNTFRWRLRNSQGSTFGENLPQSDIDAINSGDLRFPRGNRQSVWSADQDRLGITGSLQWRPTQDAEFTLDVLHGEFTNDREEIHISSRGNGSTFLGGGTTVNGIEFPNSQINAIEFNDDNEVLFLDVSGANISSETRIQQAENTFDQVVLSGKWTVSDTVRVSGLVGTEKSDYSLPKSDKFYLETFNDVTADYRAGRFEASNTFGFNTLDPNEWRAHEIDLEEFEQSSEFDVAKIALDYALTDTLTLKTGFNMRLFSNSGSRLTANNLLRSEWQSGEVDDDISAIARPFSEHDDNVWLAVDQSAAFEFFNVNREQALAEQSPSNNFTIEEDTNAVFLQLDVNTELGYMPFNANVGVRYFQTDISSTGEINGEITTVSNDYDDTLFAFNSSLEVAEDWIVRAALSENINRPSLGALNATGSVSDRGAGGMIEIVADVGNPALSPFKSNNIDISVEHYFGDFGFVGLGLFYKEVDGIVGQNTALNINFGETNLPIDLLQVVLDSSGRDDLVASSEFPVTRFIRPVNLSETDITGVELAMQSDFTFLPGHWSNLGFVGNVTLTDAELDYATPDQIANGVSVVLPLTGVSDTLANFTLYYESKRFGARISANYRSDWIQQVTPTATERSEEDRRGFNATTYVDASAFYQVNESLKLTLEAINLTDEREEQFSDEARRLYNVTQAGTTFLFGVSYRI
jgi:TonB-dependent receptor